MLKKPDTDNSLGSQEYTPIDSADPSHVLFRRLTFASGSTSELCSLLQNNAADLPRAPLVLHDSERNCVAYHLCGDTELEKFLDDTGSSIRLPVSTVSSSYTEFIGLSDRACSRVPLSMYWPSDVSCPFDSEPSVSKKDESRLRSVPTADLASLI